MGTSAPVTREVDIPLVKPEPKGLPVAEPATPFVVPVKSPEYIPIRRKEKEYVERLVSFMWW